MARSRNIKPQFFLNENLAALAPHARLLYIGLWTLADCKGRLEDRPMRIKASLFPYENLDINVLLNELAVGQERFIIRYEVDTVRYIEIPNFSKHQNPHKNEKEIGSRIPPYSGTTLGVVPDNSESSTVLVPESYPSSTEPGRNLHRTAPADSLLLIPDSLTPEIDASASGVNETNGLGIVTDENQRFGKAGRDYILSLDSINHTGMSWVSGYLSIQFQELEQSRPDLPKPQILACWRGVCDLAISGNRTRPNWFKEVFTDHLGRLTPEAQKTFAPEPASGQAKELLTFPFIRHCLTGEIFQADDLQVSSEAPNGLTDKRGAYYPAGQLEGLTEMPTEEAVYA
jgi:hypothetical protein